MAVRGSYSSCRTMDAAERTIQLQPGPQLRFVSTTADIAVFGGAAGGGKSFALLYDPLRWVWKRPGFSSAIFRRTYPQITNPGGLWDEASALYAPLGAHMIVNRMEAAFPPLKTTIAFRHMQHEDTKYDYQGSQIPYLGFDELTHFTESQFWYMLSRNRSLCGIRPYVRATCNPDSDSWLRDFLTWWIAADGYATMERAGCLRWFVRVQNRLAWFDTEQDARKEYPQLDPKSVTFIPSSVYNNAVLLKRDPGYLANLMALPELERHRLLGDPVRGGNWNIKAGGTKFRREWFGIVEAIPRKIDCVVRAWDLAATDPVAAGLGDGRECDWTAGVKMGWADGVYYVLDVIHRQASPAAIEKLVYQTAILDRLECPIRFEEEGGASGKIVTDHYARHVLQGFNFAGIPARGTKTVRANPFSAAAEQGRVMLARADWNLPFLDELESFSETCLHDDMVDAASGAHAFLSQSIVDLPGAGMPDPATLRAVSVLDAKIDALVEAINDPAERLAAHEMLKKAGMVR